MKLADMNMYVTDILNGVSNQFSTAACEMFHFPMSDFADKYLTRKAFFQRRLMVQNKNLIKNREGHLIFHLSLGKRSNTLNMTLTFSTDLTKALKTFMQYQLFYSQNVHYAVAFLQSCEVIVIC